MKPLSQDRAAVTKLTINQVLALIADRSAHHTAQGFSGAALYDKLAADTALPENFDPKVVAAILNVLPSALAQRRKRGAAPSFLRLAQNSVAYPRHVVFAWLRDRFVERVPGVASHEYTQLPPAA